jgi:serine/threonine-protein kinase
MALDDIRTAHELLRHPSIEPVLEVVRDGERWLIVKPYWVGATLQALLARGRMPIANVIHVGIEVARALGAIHAARMPDGKPALMVHRHLSLMNVLCNRAGEVMLVDVWGPVEHNRHPLMSPEQVSGRQLDARANVLSLGHMLYELVTRTRAFVADNDFEALFKIRDAKVAAMSERVAGVPDELDAIVRRCMCRRPEDRYATMSEAEAELRALAAWFAPHIDAAYFAAI